MPSPSLLSGKQWSDLPAGLQASIFSRLCTEKKKSRIRISLDTVKDVVNPLPSDLLSAAQVSEDFAAAVAAALGPRAAYLTRHVGNDELSEWVSVLAPFVKAVSTWEPQFWSQCDTYLLNQRFLNAVCEESLRLFKSLSEQTVALEVLDLKNVPFGRYGGKKDGLLNGLTAVLKRSGGSLKQLALPVAKVCASALTKAALPQLDVFEVEYHDVHFRNVTSWMKTISSREFMNMLRSLDAHNTGSKRINTPKELRLDHIRITSACIQLRDSKPFFFETVKTLCLGLFKSKRGEDEFNAIFVSLFRKLRCLRWRGAIKSSHIQIISRGCPEIEELHLSPYFISKAITSLQEEPVEMEIGLEDSLRSTQRKIKTLLLINTTLLRTTADLITEERLKIIGERCPDLEHLGLEVGYENIDGLGLLLKEYCRHIRKLDISFGLEGQRIFEPADWRRVTDSVLVASNELSEMHVSAVRFENYTPAGSFEALVQFIVDIIEFLGDRARKVHVSLVFLLPRVELMVDPMCRILRTCATHAKSLQDLRVDFSSPRIRTTWSTAEEQTNSLLLILKEKRDLLKVTPALESIHISILADEMLEILELSDEAAQA